MLNMENYIWLGIKKSKKVKYFVVTKMCEDESKAISQAGNIGINNLNRKWLNIRIHLSCLHSLPWQNVANSK